MFYSSFEDVGRKVASKTLTKIIRINDKLFSEQQQQQVPSNMERIHDLPETDETFVDMECPPDDNLFYGHRYIEKRFDEDSEINQWSQVYPHLRLTGTAMKYDEGTFLEEYSENDLKTVNNKSNAENSHYFEENMLLDISEFSDVSQELKITGQKLSVFPSSIRTNEEIFAVDGVVEEILALNCQGNDNYCDSDYEIDYDNSPEAVDKLE
eukprot:gene38623-52179_t